MSTQPTPDAVAPMELAKRGARVRTRLPVSAFERLSAEVAGGDDVVIALHFERDDRGRCRVRGSVEGQLKVTCQRCLEPVDRLLHVDVDLCVVSSEDEAQHVDAELNPVVLEAPRATLVEIVEDELLLSLPVMVCEDAEGCPRRPQLEFPAGDGPAPARKNPFAALRDLALPKK